MGDFYRQGGSVALIVRAHTPSDGDTVLLSFDDQLVLRAVSPGTWGATLGARTDESGQLVVWDTATGRRETFPDPASVDVASSLVRVHATTGRLPPARVATLTPATTDGGGLDAPACARALQALRRAGAANLLVIPGDLSPDAIAHAIAFAEERRAMFLMDPPSAWSTVDDAVAGAGAPSFARSPNAAVYFPHIRRPEPSRGPAGAVAGVIARNDATRGVWKAPAGVEAVLDGPVELDLSLNDLDGGRLNHLGVNCLRTFPGTGPVVWGARTTDPRPEWRYVPVRRIALFLEESVSRGTQWAAFEPNDEQLWARLRTEVAAFLDDLVRRGAFAGATPSEAYYVRCDSTVDGVVDVVVGFAPLKPAEFVEIRLQQLAGQA